MNIHIISCFRNATDYIEHYFDQMHALAKALAARGDRLKLILGYGDSTDGTGEMLYEETIFFLDALLVDVSHGRLVFGSIEHPQRFKQLAGMGNKLLEHVDDTADIVGIVESDLVWDAETLYQLIEDLVLLPFALCAVAPMVMDGPTSFYDVFAYRRKGERFTKTPPFHPDITPYEEFVQLDSAGSVLFMRGDLARKARFTDGQAIVGLCEEIRRYGGSIWLDPQATVCHPPYGRVEGHRDDARRDGQQVRLPAA